MKSENQWFWLITGLAFGTLLGVLVYPRIFKKAGEKSATLDPRIERVKTLLEEADNLIKKSKKR